MATSNDLQDRYGVAPRQRNDVYGFITPARLAGTMSGKVVLVTGAGRGIGKAIALAFAEAGADVALLARTKGQLDEVAEIIRSTFKRKTLVFPADVTDSVAVQEAVDEIERNLGPLDVVIPNAAAFVIRPFMLTPFEDWWRIMEIDVKAPMMLARMALDKMQSRNSGSIIFISSRVGVLTNVGEAGMSAYSVSKTALIRAAACLQLELDAKEKSGIHVYAMHPGQVRTGVAPASLHPDIEKMKPGYTESFNSYYYNSPFCSPELSAWSCVYLATGKAADGLRGRYIDVESDLEDIVGQSEIVRKEGLYDLTVNMLGGAPSVFNL